MSLPPRVFYTLTEAAARWGCSPADIAGWAAVGQLEIVTGIPPTQFGEHIIAGIVAVAAADILPMYRRCGSGPETCEIRRVREAGSTEWSYAAPPGQGLVVAKADLMIMADEVARFEDECGIFKRHSGGAGPASAYDWDGFYMAMILRIHEHGVPETQAELVGEMQDWFLSRDDSKLPDESTIRKRVSPIWRALLEQA